MMITPDIWFTLYTLSKKGAIHGKTILTTRELGEIMAISQQTASRRISFCVNKGYVARVHTVDGMLLQITDKGREELMQIMTSLEIAFTPPQDEIVIEGQIVTGLGEGAYYIDVYSAKLKNALGFKPHLGTLNVRISNDESRKAVGRMKNSPPLVLTGFRHKGRTFGDVICYRVKVNDEIEAAIVIAQRTHHSDEILEVVAPVDIRSSLKLNDDDNVRLTLIPLHLAT
ncbi:MAG: CTP-dependent riboflavin kinase [Candidatus Thorarchaeota archaeon]|jgi:riboflavin kinase|nr:MAG: CTP-dependent riboflavin kinase [Candidatus Thorarchaeota archaeon]